MAEVAVGLMRFSRDWVTARFEVLDHRQPEAVPLSLREWNSRRRSAGFLGGILVLVVVVAVLIL